MSRPRIRETCSGERSDLRPATVALSTLCGFRLPWDLVRMLRIPAASRTARTPPPAMTPVPSMAGLSSTQPAPKWPSTSCGMVLPASGTRNRFFLAFSPPLRMASGTSLALPRPTPTWPAPSPTTTRAEKLNRRPPFTTLATRLMFTTRSSRSFGLIGAAMSRWNLSLELEPGLAGGVRHRRDPAVVGEAVAVEHHLVDLGRHALLGDQPAHPLGVRLLVALVLALELLGEGGGEGHRAAGRVVHHLGVDVLEALVDGEPRALPGAGQLAPDALLPLQPGIDLGHGRSEQASGR